MTPLRDWLRKGQQGEAVRVRKVEASRAIFESEDIQRVEVRLDLEPGNDRLILDLTTAQAAKLVRELIQAHDAIHPPLRARFGST